MKLSASRSRKAWLTLTLALAAIVLSVVSAFGDVTPSTNTLTSAVKDNSDRVTVTGDYATTLHTSPNECNSLAGLTVTAFARNTTTNVVTTLGTGVTDAAGHYSFEGTTKLPTAGTYAVYTVVQGRMSGAYPNVHGCADATSNEILVTA